MAYLAVGLGLFQFHSGWGALLGFHFAMVVSLVIAKPNIPLKILFKSDHPNWVLINILLCSGSGVGLYFLWPYFGIAENLRLQLASIGLSAPTWLMFILYFTLVNPFMEEYFWRAYLGSSAKSFNIYDLIYAGYHVLVLYGKTSFPIIMFAVSVLTLAGWCWRQFAREDHGLLAPVLGHMAADFTILVAIYLNV